MPLLLDDPAARLQALEVGVVALQHEIARGVRRVLEGDRSPDALLGLTFALGHQASLLLALAAELRAGRST